MTTINTTSITIKTNGKQDTITSTTDLIPASITCISTIKVSIAIAIRDSDNNIKMIIANASDDSYRYIVAYDNLFINSKVVIGIKKTPVFPLEVASSTTQYPSGPGVYTLMTTWSQDVGVTLTNTNRTDVCALFRGGIWVVNYVFATSDERIKTNIQDINDDNALQMIMKIEPKTYEYIDKFERGDKKVYGFIAQQIREVIPEAVSLDPLTVPNIYKMGMLNNSNIITIDTDISDMIKIDSNILLITSNLGKNEYKVTEVINSNQFKINSNIENYDNINNSNIFVYGTKVNDFHTLNKDYIFTLNVCATQELYKLIQTQINKINILNNKYDLLINKLQTQEEEINNLINYNR